MNITTSFGQPVQITETPNGLLVRRREVDRSEAWYRDGLRHRDDGPSITSYYVVFLSDGSIATESWYQDGELHRDNGPAMTQYDFDGSIRFVSWYRDGLRHRNNGPAYIDYRVGKVFPGDTRTFEELEKAGAVDIARWYRNGKEVKRFT